MSTLDVLCWGDVGWDDYAGEASPRPGGCALNVALALRQAGVRVGCLGAVGEDGRALRRFLDERGVDVRWLDVLPGATARQPIRLEPDGERVLHDYRGGVLNAHRPGPAALAALREAAWVYLPVFAHTVPLVEELFALRPAAPVALDLGDLSELEPAFVARAQARADLVFCGLDPRAQDAARRELAQRAAGKDAALTIITLGAAGSAAHRRGERLLQEALPVPGGRVVDTTGCGDAFAGTFLAHWLRAPDLGAALKAASGRAAQVAAHRGAVPA